MQKPSWKETSLVIVVGLVQTVAVVFIAQWLIQLINLCTNLFYHGELAVHATAPDPHAVGWISIFIPAFGGLIVGIMARFGSRGIRGHGIPEAMESILMKESRIPRRLTFLKPISSAIAIGSGGPFGAEGPIIATGGALGSWVGQVTPLHESSRKVLLASGAAAGMTAIFGTPLAAVLLAIELLLFEFKAWSFIPVALCAALAAVVREQYFGIEKPFFEMHGFPKATLSDFIVFLIFGAILGLLSVFVIRSVYWIEDKFEELPVHWMLWPALGGIVVGIVGWFDPRSLGVGYDNITNALQNNLTLGLAITLLVFKFISWAVALGSGTSGGTLAPLMTLGACIGLIFSAALSALMPNLHVSPEALALVGMAGLFAGASRSVLASVLFAFEATQQTLSLVPLLETCTIAYIFSRTFCEDSIMTLKIVRRGVQVPHEYVPAPTPRPSPSTIAERP